jgi:hypothetical protein
MAIAEHIVCVDVWHRALVGSYCSRGAAAQGYVMYAAVATASQACRPVLWCALSNDFVWKQKVETAG